MFSAIKIMSTVDFQYLYEVNPELFFPDICKKICRRFIDVIN